jgi:hypothetical protein
MKRRIACLARRSFAWRSPRSAITSLLATVDDESAFQFVNVARWESAEALANALKSGTEEGSDLWTSIQELRRLGARVSQNNYVQEVEY